MAEIPCEKKFAVLTEISRAQHFAWRETLLRLAPDLDARYAVEEMWRITGRLTATGYLKRLDPTAPLPAQVATSIVWSSRCMGESADVVQEGEVAFVRHTDCPWVRWHEKLDLLSEDRPGCDAWFESMLETINTALDTRLRFETLESLPEGAATCLRRIWMEV